MSEEYERGYREGMEHISSQVGYLNEQVQKVTSILTRAVFTNPASTPPRPGIRLWLVLDPDMITTGYYLNSRYISDSGFEVEPMFWCMIPKVVTGEDDSPRRRLLKPD